jgi:hypothetical protein
MALWTTLLNRFNSLALPRKLLKSSQYLFLAVIPAGPIGFLLLFFEPQQGIVSTFASAGAALLDPFSVSPWPAAYLLLCWALAPLTVLIWLVRRLRPVPAALLSNHTRRVDVEQQLGRRPVSGLTASVLSRVPGNQILQLDVNEKQLQIAGLPPQFDGLTIAHVSDLHYTGKFTQDFYHRVVDEINALAADLIAVTGDVFDKQHCLDWTAPTLGRLRAPLGVYVILGNHDRRLRDTAAVRRTLTDSGLIDLGGRWHVLESQAARLLLAGNEHPWFGPRPRAEDCPAPVDEAKSLRILLSHTPDQINWARRLQFDLMLAGHNHGGQIRFPVIGPIVSPSAYGVKYASGLFYEPPTLLHVSRGVCGDKPIRLNCPPEITKLILTASAASVEA